MQYTFKTGRTVEVIPISPWLLADAQASIPKPTPPVQSVDMGDGPVEVENPAHPDYQEALRQWRVKIEEQLAQLAIMRGTTFELDAEAVAKVRADATALSITLPPEADDDRYLYLFYVCPGSQDDIYNLFQLIQGRSIVTEEAVVKATEHF